jgi:hypothetical protein
VHKFIIAALLSGLILPAQSGRQVVPPVSVHQYSGITLLSVNNDNCIFSISRAMLASSDFAMAKRLPILLLTRRHIGITPTTISCG